MLGYWKRQAVLFLPRDQKPSVLFQSIYFVRMFPFISELSSFLYSILLKYWKLFTLLWRRFLSYRNQSIDLQSISMDWFLYDRDFRHARVKIKRPRVGSGIMYLEVEKLSKFLKHSDVIIIFLISSFVYLSIKSSMEKCDY